MGMPPSPVSSSSTRSWPKSRYMNGPSKLVHSDWRRMYVFSSYRCTWISGSPQSVPSFHITGNSPVHDCVAPVLDSSPVESPSVVSTDDVEVSSAPLVLEPGALVES